MRKDIIAVPSQPINDEEERGKGRTTAGHRKSGPSPTPDELAANASRTPPVKGAWRGQSPGASASTREKLMPVSRRAFPRFPAVIAILAFAAPCLAAQGQQPRNPCPDTQRSDRPSHCEIREMSVPASGDGLTVDATPNGGIAVRGWERPEIQLQARVVTNASTEEQAKALAGQIKVLTDGGRIRAEGPRAQDGTGWSVSFDLMVPSRGALDLRTTNGGVSVTDVEGRVAFRTTNGGIDLANVNGDVRGSTLNGGVRVTLRGAGWNGEGLDVETLNGGVQLRVPDGYSAHLEAATRNGGLQIDFPVTVQGNVGRTLSTDLGRGGAPSTCGRPTAACRCDASRAGIARLEPCVTHARCTGIARLEPCVPRPDGWRGRRG